MRSKALPLLAGLLLLAAAPAANAEAPVGRERAWLQLSGMT